MRQIGSCPCHFPDAWLFTYWQLYLLSAVMVGLLPATSSWSQQEALNRCGRHRHGASLRGTRYPCFHPWNCYNPCLVFVNKAFGAWLFDCTNTQLSTFCCLTRLPNECKNSDRKYQASVNHWFTHTGLG